MQLPLCFFFTSADALLLFDNGDVNFNLLSDISDMSFLDRTESCSTNAHN